MRSQPPIVKVCRCGIEFRVYPYRVTTALNCSRSCTVKYRVNPLKGRKFPNSSLAKLGDKNPMYGQKATLAQRLAASATMTRLHSDPEFQSKVIRRGAANNMWRGGVTPANERERRTPEYKAWRVAVFERDRYTCQMCGVVGGYLEADHIKRFADCPEFRTVLSNGRTLCKKCHLQITKSQTGSKVLIQGGALA